jgi:DNA-binding CsgD family transcriptional regulator
MNELGLALPAWMRDWAPALTLWPVVDEARFAMTLRCLGVVADWERFTVAASTGGLVEPGPRAGTLVFRPEWAAALEAGLDSLGGREALRATIVDRWSPEMDPFVVAEIAVWARDQGHWGMVEEAWIRLNVHSELQTRELLALFRDLPIEARVARPMLTWAYGAAGAALVAQDLEGAETIPTAIMLDGAMLHASWSTRDDTETAVHAGTFRMLGERRQPSTRPGQALEAAWRTKEEVEAFIDARSREGRGPSRRTQALFRVMSAQLALARANTLDAIDEARWAVILADVEPVRVLARGVEALALSLSLGDAPMPDQEDAFLEITDPLGVRGMRGMGQAFAILAAGTDALRRLDREGVEWTLTQLSPQDAAFAGVWAVRAALEAFRDATWGDLGDGLQHLSAEIARRSRAGHEQDEVLGAAMLGRARMILLIKSGAFSAATASIENLPDGLRLLPQARTHLWAGQFDQAILVADAGAYDEGRGMIDRHQLLIVKAAASRLARRSDAELGTAAINEMRHLLATENLVPLGVLPKPARDSIIELCTPELGQEPNFAVLLERLAELNDAGERGVRPLHLTDRERVLLPLLATEATVPEIARRLQVSVNTVRKQVVTLREKFGAESRTELVRKARAYGAIP